MSIPVLIAATLAGAPIPADIAAQQMPTEAASTAQIAPPVADPAAQPPIILPAPAAEPAPPMEGDIVVQGQLDIPGDPLSGANLASFEVTQEVDGALVAPMADAYQAVLPSPVRSGLHNALMNVTEPVVFINFLLQGKPGKAIETLGRFVVNSTIGIAGLIDVAKKKPFNLPHRANGFAYTLGFYGVKTGAYLFLPLIGPTTVRDMIGGGLDRLVLPLGVGSPFNKPLYSLTTGAISSLDRRIASEGRISRAQNSVDAYAAIRDDYLGRRQAAIDELRGRTPAPAVPAP